MTYRDVFLTLNSKGVTYVVLRRYDSLPERTIESGSDVDILVEPEQFQDAIDAIRTLGFEAKGSSGPSRLRVFRMAITKPRKAILELVNDPHRSIRKILLGTTAPSGNPRHKNAQLSRDAQLVDLQNNLAYKSPMDGSKIPVNPTVTEGMLDRRVTEDCFYVPARPDELAHLVAHCVFDKNGTFPPYYAERCSNMFSAVRSDPDQQQLFEDLLERIFFKASQLVFDLVAEERYSEIRGKLREYSDY